MIKTNQLRKVYDNGFEAVKSLSLHVNKGDIYGFLGPNGAGKTTTIRMLIGLIEPTSGDLEVSNLNVKKNKGEIKNLIGVLPESHGYYEWMTGEEYLLFFSALHKINKQQRKDKVTELLDLVSLTAKANVKVSQYSRGMRQRLGIARTLIHDPEIIFLDEPTLGLDPQGQKDIENILLHLNQVKGVTIFITSHLLKDIEKICNRVAIVKAGTLIEEDSVKGLMDKYKKDIHKDDLSLEDVFFHLTSDGKGEQ
ncbi:ABC transporter [Neobacillus bataviensis LMG 21833]|uniref:ABC transporter n=1 Tax=Neobacillus bataviensis LMG 21833 TaxID=1117379 RepID=K6DVC0_9BACI|nr:ABC transporter ATP-binding protein [Neobacillus bataviensis]EKN64771.1 ABC transporter [Neobacillus bataviensis LMG 21833]